MPVYVIFNLTQIPEMCTFVKNTLLLIINCKLPTLLFLNNLGGGEVLIIVFVILIFFGPKKIPELARGLGRAMREFKDASDNVKREITESVNSVKRETNVTKEITNLGQDIKKDLNT